MPNKSTLICTPTVDNNLSVGYSSALLRTVLLFMRNGIQVGTNYQIGDDDLPRARNFLAGKFLESSFDNLLFVDPNIMWDEQAVLDMVNSDHLICAGAYRETVQDLIPKFSVLFEGMEVDGWQKASYAGAGLLLIRREALEIYRAYNADRIYTSLGSGKAAVAFFQSGIQRNADGQAFDMSAEADFCKRWTGLGQEIWVKKDFYTERSGFNVWPGNISLHTVTDEAAKEQDAQRAEEIAAVGAHEPVIVHRDMAAE